MVHRLVAAGVGITDGAVAPALRPVHDRDRREPSPRHRAGLDARTRFESAPGFRDVGGVAQRRRRTPRRGRHGGRRALGRRRGPAVVGVPARPAGSCRNPVAPRAERGAQSSSRAAAPPSLRPDQRARHRPAERALRSLRQLVGDRRSGVAGRSRWIAQSKARARSRAASVIRAPRVQQYESVVAPQPLAHGP